MVLSFVDPGECVSVDVSPVNYSDSDSEVTKVGGLKVADTLPNASTSVLS